MTTFSLTVCDVCGARTKLSTSDLGLQAKNMPDVLYLRRDEDGREADLCLPCLDALIEAMQLRVQIRADQDMAVGA